MGFFSLANLDQIMRAPYGGVFMEALIRAKQDKTSFADVSSSRQVSKLIAKNPISLYELFHKYPRLRTGQGTHQNSVEIVFSLRKKLHIFWFWVEICSRIFENVWNFLKIFRNSTRSGVELENSFRLFGLNRIDIYAHVLVTFSLEDRIAGRRPADVRKQKKIAAKRRKIVYRLRAKTRWRAPHWKFKNQKSKFMDFKPFQKVHVKNAVKVHEMIWW